MTHPPLAESRVLKQVIGGNIATNMLWISRIVAALVLMATLMRWSPSRSAAPSTKCNCRLPFTPSLGVRTKATWM